MRVHPGKDYRADLHMIVLEDDEESYIVRPELYPDLNSELKTMSLFTTINRQGVVFLWPIRLPTPDGKITAWSTSAREAAEKARTQWVRLVSNRSLGAYEIVVAENCSNEPEWPPHTFQELIRIGFRDRLIDTLDHLVVRRLRGLA